LRVSFRVSCRGFLSGVFIRISSGFLWISPRVFRVSFWIQTGENKAKEKNNQQKGSKDRKQRSRGAGSRAAKTHD
jgi:hypothetical protein